MTSQDSASPQRRVQVICLLVIAVIATGAALQAMADVMIPFALAMFLAIALSPVVDGLAERTRLSRPLSVALTMLLGVLLLAVVGGVVASSIADYNQRFGAPGVDGAVQEAGVATSNVRDGEGAAGQGALAGLVTRLPEKLQGAVGDLTGKLESLLPGLVALLGTVLSQGVTVVIFLLFLLLEQRNERDSGVGGEVRERVKQYISVKVLTSAVTGIAVGLALWAVGAPMPMLFGLVTFLLNFIPTIGSVIAVALPLPLLLATDATTLTIVLALALPGAIQFAVGQIWENKLLGDAFDLRASVVLLALVFWGKIWGIVGMILATPIAAVLKTLMEGQELTRPLARLMGQAGGSASSRVDASS
ncbi:MAG: AI-2E family transporter [Planctomycetota bacterium]|nr:AI-2E family transporter [Planctomycetota bacterium]MEC8513554.1 AI-2E family transporter [Planctomycetota bacterium]